MKTIETMALIGEDRILKVQLPREVIPMDKGILLPGTFDRPVH